MPDHARADVRSLAARQIRTLAWGAAVALAAAAPLLAVLASGRTLVWRDTASLHAPMRGLIVEALRDLRLPLWNPHEGFGLPLLAQLMHGVLHPVSVAAAFLAPGAGIDLLLVLNVMLAALGAAALARRVGASPAGAVAAGLAYALSGYALGMTSNLTYLTAAGTAPWAVAAAQAAGAGRRHAVPAAALAFCALAFAGDPQWWVVAAVLGAALALEAGAGRGLARAFAGIALGLALAAVQLVPTSAFHRETLRAAGLSAADRVQWALSPWRLPELIAPGFFFGRPGESLVAPVFLRLGGPSAADMPFVPSAFVGAAVLSLALAGARVSRAARILAGAAMVSLWIALGTRLGAEQALRAVPIWGEFRYAEKLLGPFALCVAVLGGLGVDRFGREPNRRWISLIAAAALAAAALAAAFATWPGAGALLRAAGAGDAAALACRQLATGLAHATAGWGLLAGLLAAARRWPVLEAKLPAAVAVLVFLQSAAAAPFALHAGLPGALDGAPLRALASWGVVTRVVHPLPPRTDGVGPPGLDAADREIAVKSRMGADPYAVPSRIDHADAYTGLYPRRLKATFNALGAGLRMGVWPALRRFATTHVVLRQPASQFEVAMAEQARAGGRLVMANGEWGFAVWEVPHRPWASFAAQAVTVESDGEALQALVDVLRREGPEVVLEGPPGLPLAPGRLLGFERAPERVRIEAESAQDGLLVVNDAWWPGWTASVDGRPVPIWRADAVVRAVPWPAGRHALEMRYDPPEVRTGLLVSGAAAAVLLLVVLAPVLRRRRRAGDAGESETPS